MDCQHNYKLQGDHMACSKCGHVRKFNKISIKPKILVIGLIASVMIVGAVCILLFFPS